MTYSRQEIDEWLEFHSLNDFVTDCSKDSGQYYEQITVAFEKDGEPYLQFTDYDENGSYELELSQ